MKVIICDDQSIIRDGLELLLRLEEDIEVVGKAQNGAEAIELAAAHRPDLILMDLKMPVVNGVEATRILQRDYPKIKVLTLTTFTDDEWLFDALRAGAAGYLLKDASREEIVSAIRGTMEGKTYLDPRIAGFVLDKTKHRPASTDNTALDRLSEREMEVLRCISEGLGNREIAGRMHLSEGTVRNHVSSIFSKLGVTDRTQAAILAIRQGLVD